MRLILLLVISCLALHNANGAPATARYKYIKCNPADGQANCVTHQSPEMEWSPDLPTKLSASAAEDLEAEPVEDESPLMEDNNEEEQEDEEETGEEESPLNESPLMDVGEEGSAGYEGSAAEGPYMADKSDLGETGSGMFWTKSKDVSGLGWLPVSDEAKPAENELKEDHLLQP